AHRVVPLAEGEDDLTMPATGEGSASRPTVLLRDADFGDDEERDHDVYTSGDDLGIVRVGGAGSVAIRERAGDGALGAWRKLRSKIARDDDVVVVDADAHTVLVVTTRDEGERCTQAAGGGASVHALRVDRH